LTRAASMARRTASCRETRQGGRAVTPIFQKRSRDLIVRTPGLIAIGAAKPASLPLRSVSVSSAARPPRRSWRHGSAASDGENEIDHVAARTDILS
jgi:hypothetical protein